MTKQIEKENIKAICSHCGEEIDSVWICRVDSTIGVRYIYFCSNCQQNLGIYLNKELPKENASIKVLA